MASPMLHGLFSARVAERWRELQTTKTYDLLAAMPLVLIFAASGANVANELWSHLKEADFAAMDLRQAISLIRQGVALALIVLLMTFLLLRAPAKAKAKGLMPRAAAFLGTFLGVAVTWLPLQPIGLGLSLASLLMMFLGAAFSVYSIAHLGRSFSVMAEGRRLVTNGPYFWVRHPLYLGEELALVGLALQYASPLAFAIIAVQFAFQLWRMKNEEAVLASLFPDYEAYRARTARLIPGVY